MYALKNIFSKTANLGAHIIFGEKPICFWKNVLGGACGQEAGQLSETYTQH